MKILTTALLLMSALGASAQTCLTGYLHDYNGNPVDLARTDILRRKCRNAGYAWR